MGSGRGVAQTRRQSGPYRQGLTIRKVVESSDTGHSEGGLGKGVQYTQGKLTRGGTWGGGTEHQALAMILKVNIVIWDRRYIGRVGAQHRQLYVCTPQGNTFLRNIKHTSELIKQSEYGSIHVLYDDAAKHYEHFGSDTMEENTGGEQETMGEREAVMYETETGRRKEEEEGEKVKLTTMNSTRNTTVGEETISRGNRIGITGTGEEPGIQNSEVHVGTLNISGIAFGYRGRYMKTEEELLKIKPGDTLREVIEMMKAQEVSLMTLTDTHLSQEAMGEVGNFLQQEGLGGGGSPPGRKCRRKIYASRVARVNIRVLDPGKEIKVYGVYMPVRDNKAEKTGEIWDALTQDITERGTRNFIIKGDFTAEIEAWISRTGRTQKEEDVVYQGVLEDLNMVASIAQDYTFERAQTQIENILVPIELIHNLKEAHVTTGVRETDHKLVMATLAWEMKGEKGEYRPTRRYTDKFQELHWLRYERIIQERVNKIQEKMEGKRPSDRLGIIHNELTKAAAEVAEEAIEIRGVKVGGLGGSNRRE
eukprot:1509994-Pleurochrysis_carterae.AAC.1